MARGLLLQCHAVRSVQWAPSDAEARRVLEAPRLVHGADHGERCSVQRWGGEARPYCRVSFGHMFADS